MHFSIKRVFSVTLVLTESLEWVQRVWLMHLLNFLKIVSLSSRREVSVTTSFMQVYSHWKLRVVMLHFSIRQFMFLPKWMIHSQNALNLCVYRELSAYMGFYLGLHFQMQIQHEGTLWIYYTSSCVHFLMKQNDTTKNWGVI